MSCPRGCCPDYKTHIHGISIGNFPTTITHTESKWEVDMAAYKRLREDGLQPPKIDGCRAIEQNAKNEREVTMGRPMNDLAHKVFDDAGI